MIMWPNKTKRGVAGLVFCVFSDENYMLLRDIVCVRVFVCVCVLLWQVSPFGQQSKCACLSVNSQFQSVTGLKILALKFLILYNATAYVVCIYPYHLVSRYPYSLVFLVWYPYFFDFLIWYYAVHIFER